MEKEKSLTGLLFGTPSDIVVHPEITEEFVKMGLEGIKNLRLYLYDLGYSEDKLEEILLEIHDEVERRNSKGEFKGLLASVCLELGAFYLGRNHLKAEKFLLKAFSLRSEYYGEPDKAVYLADVMNALGIHYALKRDYKKAEIMFEEQYLILKELCEKTYSYGDDYRKAAYNLANLYFDKDRIDEALKLLRELLKNETFLEKLSPYVYHLTALIYDHIGDKEAYRYYFRAAYSEFCYRTGLFDIVNLASKAYEKSGDAEIYVFLIGYLVSEGMMTVEKAKNELKAIKNRKAEFLLEVLDDLDDLKEVSMALHSVVLYRKPKPLPDTSGMPYPAGLFNTAILHCMYVMSGGEDKGTIQWISKRVEKWVLVRRMLVRNNLGYEIPEIRKWLKKYVRLGDGDLSELDEIIKRVITQKLQRELRS